MLFVLNSYICADNNVSNANKSIENEKNIHNKINEYIILEYNKQYIVLNNKVMDLDTNIEKTKKDLTNLENKLSYQKQYYENLMSTQRDRFQDLMETERWIFGLIGGFFIIIFAITSFLGNKFINRKINKLTKREYQDNLVTNIKNSVMEDDELQKAIIAEIIKNEEFNSKIAAIINSNESEVETVTTKPEGFKGLKDGEV